MNSSDRSAEPSATESSEATIEQGENGFSMSFNETGAWHTPVRTGLWDRIREDWRLAWTSPQSFKRGEGD